MPRLFPLPHPHAHRHATWLELFFDLIFVAAVADVARPLHDDTSLAGLGRFAFLFLLIWWAWSGYTLYSTRFDAEDLLGRVLVLFECFLVAVMAANSGGPLDSVDSAGFGAAYGGMRLILAVQYLRVRRIPETRILATRFAIGSALAAALWIVSAVSPAPWRFVLWGAALATDFLTPWIAEPGASVPPDAHHYPERFGLFTIILLGEAVVSVMQGIAGQPTWSVPAATAALASFAIVFALWWWYFYVARGAESRLLRTRRDTTRFHLWQYAHLPLFLSIALTGAGLEHLIAAANTALHASDLRTPGAALLTAMAALAAIRFSSNDRSAARRNPIPAPATAGSQTA